LGETVKVPYAKKWQKEADKLRKIVLDCDLIEEIKWGNSRHPAEGRVRALVLQRRAAKRPETHPPKDRSGAGRPLD